MYNVTLRVQKVEPLENALDDVVRHEFQDRRLQTINACIDVVDLDVLARVLADENLVPGLDVHGDPLAVDLAAFVLRKLQQIPAVEQDLAGRDRFVTAER